MSLNKIELLNLKFWLNCGLNEFLQDKAQNRYNLNNKLIKTSNNISDINSLEKLQFFIKNSNICDLKKNANKTVFADGNPNSSIMFIGEAPGADEDKMGKPFVGKAGKLLDKMLLSINLDRKKVYITNVIPWRPPNNRAPTNEEILKCLPFVQKHIELVNPDILILLGGTATKALLTSTKNISKIRGKWNKYNNLGLKKPIATMAMFHPAYILRNPNIKKLVWEDLIEIKKKLI
mgnify:CR=1 FL=1